MMPDLLRKMPTQTKLDAFDHATIPTARFDYFALEHQSLPARRHNILPAKVQQAVLFVTVDGNPTAPYILLILSQYQYNYLKSRLCATTTS